MDICLAMHGKAVKRDVNIPDFQRTLVKKGKEESLDMAKKIKKVGICPDLLISRERGKYSTCVTIPPILKKGSYSMDLSFGKLFSASLDFHENALSFKVEENSINPRYKSFSSIRAGIVASNLSWKTFKK